MLILDCSTHLPGAKAAKLLADRGATVIKFENPKFPDPTREFPARYQYYNDKKQLIQLDLSNPTDYQSFILWVKKADALIEGYRPKTKVKLGLTPERLHQINPNLVILSLSGYSKDSPYIDRAGHDINFEALCGTLSLFNEMPALPLGQMALSYLGAIEILSQLANPSRPKKVIELSVTQALMDLQGSLIAEYTQTGSLPKPGKTLYSGFYPCYRIYQAQCKTRIAVGAIEPKFWTTLCDALMLPELAGLGLTTQEPTRTEIIEKIAIAFASKPWKEWEQLFLEKDCCVEPVLEFDHAMKLRDRL